MRLTMAVLLVALAALCFLLAALQVNTNGKLSLRDLGYFFVALAWLAS